MLDMIFGVWLNSLKQIWWVIPIVLLLVTIRTPLFKGWFGEKWYL